MYDCFSSTNYLLSTLVWAVLFNSHQCPHQEEAEIFVASIGHLSLRLLQRGEVSILQGGPSLFSETSASFPCGQDQADDQEWPITTASPDYMPAGGPKTSLVVSVVS